MGEYSSESEIPRRVAAARRELVLATAELVVHLHNLTHLALRIIVRRSAVTKRHSRSIMMPVPTPYTLLGLLAQSEISLLRAVGIYK